MYQPTPNDEIKKWHGHADLCINNLEEVINIPHDSDIGFSLKSI